MEQQEGLGCFGLLVLLAVLSFIVWQAKYGRLACYLKLFDIQQDWSCL